MDEVYYKLHPCLADTLSNEFCYVRETEDGRRYQHQAILPFWRMYYKEYQAYITKKGRYPSYYEVIQVDRPCRLYLDIEYEYQYNPLIRAPNRILKRILNLLAAYLSLELDIEVKKSGIVILESKSKVKYSRHVIIHLKKEKPCYWRSNLDCGHFIKAFMQWVDGYIQDQLPLPIHHPLYPIKGGSYDPQELSTLYVVDRDKNRLNMIDMGVYNKNRSFRMLFSSKYHKHEVLYPAMMNPYPYAHHYDLFVASLVQGDLPPLQQCDPSQLIQYHIPPPTLPTPLPVLTHHTALESYIRDLASQPLGQSVEVKCVPSTYSLGIIVFDIIGSKYCYPIQREHKSNHIYYVVNLHSATVSQRCHDPNCKGTYTYCQPLPPSLLYTYRSLYGLSTDIPTHTMSNEDKQMWAYLDALEGAHKDKN